MLPKKDQKLAEELMEDYPEQTEDVSPDKEEEKSKKTLPYILELFMSTDGKHTVHVTVENPEARKEAVQKGMEMYDYVVTRYGTKQAQAVREYGNGERKPSQETCKHTNIKFAQSKTEKNPGRWFKACKDCGKFLGWQS